MSYPHKEQNDDSANTYDYLPFTDNEKYDYQDSVGTNISVIGNLVVIRTGARVEGKGNLGTRNSINGFSASSAIRMRRYLRSCVAEYGTMLTLTYPCGHGYEGRSCKDDIRRFIQELRRYTIRNEPSGSADQWSTFWFMEFQERGSIHFHMFTTHRYPKEWVARRWYEIVGSEDERHLLAGTRIESIKAKRAGTISYASKYAVKSEQKVVPESFGWSGRFWGVCGLRSTMAASIFVTSRMKGNAGVQNAIEGVKTSILDALATNKAIQLPKKREDCAVYVIKSAYDLAKIRKAVFWLEIKCCLSMNFSEKITLWSNAIRGIDDENDLIKE